MSTLKIPKLPENPPPTKPKLTDWEMTDAALRVIKRAFDDLFDRKPKEDKKNKWTPEMLAWEAEHREVELWAQSVGTRRHEINIKNLKEWRDNQAK